MRENLLFELDAYRQIHDVLSRVARGVDRLDKDLMISGYHSDAIDYHGSFEGSPSEFADWVIQRHTGNIDSCVHFLGNTFIQINGLFATCESYVVVFYRFTREGIKQDMISPGRYLDKFECRDGVWKISERLVVYEKDRIDPVVNEMNGPLTQMLVKGSRNNEDVSYGFLANKILEERQNFVD